MIGWKWLNGKCYYLIKMARCWTGYVDNDYVDLSGAWIQDAVKPHFGLKPVISGGTRHMDGVIQDLGWELIGW